LILCNTLIVNLSYLDVLFHADYIHKTKCEDFSLGMAKLFSQVGPVWMENNSYINLGSEGTLPSLAESMVLQWLSSMGTPFP